MAPWVATKKDVQSRDSHEPSLVVVGGLPTPARIRVWRAIWPVGPSRWRKLLAGGVVAICLALTAAFVLPGLLPWKPSTPKIAQFPKAQRQAAAPSSGSEPSPQNTTPSASPSNPAGTSSPGTGGSGSSGGSSSGGSTGGGSSGAGAVSSWPTPATTGVPAGVTPVAGGSCTITTAGTVITGKVFACASTAGLDIKAANVTIRNSFIETGLYWGVIIRPGASLVIEDSTIGDDSACGSRDSSISGGDFTARRVKITSGGDAFDIGFTKVSGSYVARGNVLVEDSYAKLCAQSPAHSDGVQPDHGGPNVVISHNTIDMSFSADDAQTAPIFWGGDTPYALTLTSNLLIAGSYTIRIHDGTGHIVTGNVVARNKWKDGPTAIDVPVAQCSGNQLADVSASYVPSNFSSLSC